MGVYHCQQTGFKLEKIDYYTVYLLHYYIMHEKYLRNGILVIDSKNIFILICNKTTYEL